MKTKPSRKPNKKPDDFESVAKRLECDDDKATAKLKKIAKTKAKPAKGK